MVRVGALALCDNAPLFFGVANNDFSDEGLKVTISSPARSDEIISGVVQGVFDIGYIGVAAILGAIARGSALRFVAGGVVASSDPSGSANGLLVGSSISMLSDLAGGVIGSSGPQSQGEVVVRDALAKHGVDTSSITFVTIPLPEMVASVAIGSVDGVVTAEPYLSRGRTAGLRILFNPFAEVVAGLPIGAYFCCTKELDARPEVWRAFIRALGRSYAHARDHQDELRAFIPSFTGFPPSEAARVSLGYWPSTTIDTASIAAVAELLARHGMVARKDLRPATELVWQ